MKKIYLLFGSVLLFSQLLGLIFCGDADCLQGSSDEGCTTLLCGLLAKHTAPVSTSDGGSYNSCDCYCHALIDLPKVTLYTAPLGVSPLHSTEVVLLFSTPVHDIDHPPLA